MDGNSKLVRIHTSLPPSMQTLYKEDLLRAVAAEIAELKDGRARLGYALAEMKDAAVALMDTAQELGQP